MCGSKSLAMTVAAFAVWPRHWPCRLGASGWTLNCAPVAPHDISDDGEAMRLFRRRCVYNNSIHGYGNWCWRAYDIPMPDAAWLLHHAIRGEKFSCTGASGNNACRLSDALDENASLSEVTLYLGLFGC